MTTTLFDIETTGLAPIECVCKDPREIKLNRILSIGVWNIEEDKKECFTKEDEREILINFSNFIRNEIWLVGFNCEFDLNFIRVRSFYNNVKLPENFNDLKIINLRKILNSNEYAHGKLSEYGKMCGFEAKTEDGKQMPIFYENKQFDKIKEHNLEDLELTNIIYQRCKNCNLL
jgi:uncharacterized protein YprB with RNaseH-like and TPR domain